MSQALGSSEASLLAYAQMRGLRTVRSGDLTGPLQLTDQQERELLSRMSRKGTLVRVRRGLYLVPPRLPLGGRWSPGDALALTTLMQDREATHQICGPSAFNRYGLDGQTPARLHVYNDRISGERSIGPTVLSLIKVATGRLGDTEEVQTPESPTLVYSSRTRTLMDAVYDWSRFGSLPRAYQWIEQELETRRSRSAELIDTTIRFGNQGTARRIGALLERLGVGTPSLEKLHRTLRSAKSLIPFVPDRPLRGTLSRRWGVVLNEQQ